MHWGILATGTIASKFASTVSAMAAEGEKLIAVGSRDLAKAEAFASQYGDVRAYGSYEALLQDPDVDAVYIATPNNLHFENTMLCLNAGKHVLCEKAFTTCARDAEILYRTAAEKGRFVMEAFWIRFLPLYQQLLRRIANGEFGKLRYVRCEYGFVAKGARRERKFLPELGGGALLDIGIYNLGFLRMLTGQNPVSFTTEMQRNEYGTDQFSVLQLRYPGDVMAHSMQAIGVQTNRYAVLYCDKAAIELPDFQGAYTMIIHYADGSEQTVHCPPEINGFEYEIREVSRCVREGKTCSAVFPPADSIATIQLMDQIRANWEMTFPYE